MHEAALEIGSEFHWLGLPAPPFHTWPQPHVWFALGSDAALAGCSGGAFWVPDYFCPETTAHWAQAGMALHRYADDPRWPHPDWDTLAPAPGDTVVAVNYFGVRAGEPWRTWQQAHDSVTLLEDHSHDPLSGWALRSQADYAFASIRKTHPVPDGGILWSPRGRPLPPGPNTVNWEGSGLKLAGMIWKAGYLAGSRREPALKEVFRRLHRDGEEALAAWPGYGISPWSRAFLAPGSPLDWRRQREANVRFLLQELRGLSGAQPLFTDWPAEHCPFHAVLLCPSAALRDTIRAELIAAGVYAPVHWQLGPEASPRCQDLAERILTLPADQRYGPHDLARAVSVLARSFSVRPDGPERRPDGPRESTHA